MSVQLPFANAVKLLKRVSLISCISSIGALGIVSSEIFPSKVPKNVQLAVMSTAAFMGTTSTLLLHYCLRGYVLRIQNHQNQIKLTTMRLFKEQSHIFDKTHLEIKPELMSNVHVKSNYRNNSKLNDFYVSEKSLDLLKLNQEQ
eukprot:NODE_299_length_10456_cov_1.003669.p11 type:complete len:144 gc:universal NODE_299_length_10456_cov_1.003669:3292-3723(+)